MIEPVALPAPAGTADERTVLEGFLEQYRTIILRKTAGVDDDRARQSTLPSGSTVAGLVRHVRWVEEAWFVEALGGAPRPQWRDTDPGRQFRAGTEPLADLVADYRRACDRSRVIAAAHSLDDTGHNPRLGEVSLRWILVHMIEELARHAGHLDILLEQLDGRVGFD